MFTQKKGISLKIKLIATPVLILLIAILSITYSSYLKSSKALEEQLLADGITLGNKVVEEIETTYVFDDILNEQIEDKIRSVAKIIGNLNIISNEALIKIGEASDIDVINISDSTRTILYSNYDVNIGETYEDSHPMTPMFSGQINELMEPIRKSTDEESTEYFKFGSVKAKDNFYIQIGLTAQSVMDLQNKLNKQTILSKLESNKNIIYAIFTNNDFIIDASTNKELLGIDLSNDENTINAIRNDKITYTKNYSNEYYKNVIDLVIPVKYKNNIVGVMNIGISREKYINSVHDLFISALLIGFFSIVIGTLLILITITKFIKPIYDLSDIAKEISSGNLSKHVKKTSNDEIGLLQESFNYMIINLRTMIVNIRDISKNILDDSTEISNSTTEVSVVSEQISKSIADIADGSSNQLQLTLSIGSNIADVVEDIHTINNKIDDLSKESHLTSNVIVENKDKINDMTNQMNIIDNKVSTSANSIIKLNNTFNEIVQIVDIINNIASQTNLLALNASIESARAGEAGKGFSVVADEIRKLAEDTVKSADNIKDLISTTHNQTKITLDNINSGNEETKIGSKILNEVLFSLEGLFDKFDNIKNTMSHVNTDIITIKEKSDNIKNNISKIENITEISASNSQEVSASTEEQTASLETIGETLINLKNIVQDLNKNIDKFIV
ncbi:methyl-accepting chemotaxis protein [Peptostreptococcaceae bacterium AGR-M142]